MLHPTLTEHQSCSRRHVATPRVATWVIGTLLTLLGGACGEKDKSPDTATSPHDKAIIGSPTSYAGLAIASVTADYSSSSLYFQGLKEGERDGEIKTLLTGESGVPLPLTIEGKLYFFNRSATSSNFRTLDPSAADGAPSAQTRTQDAGLGDPHAALKLSGDRLLLAHYTAGKLTVINPTDGSRVQEITADWDLGTEAGAPFRPEALYLYKSGTKTEIYVVHQGRTADFSGFNGSQQLFVLEDDGKSLTVVDVDTNAAKVQGIKLHILNPQIIEAGSDPAKPIVAGFCTVFDQANPCTSGFERVDLVARTSTLIYDTTTLSEKGNGRLVAGADGTFYGAVAVANGTAYQSSIHTFDVTNSTHSSFYEITDANYASFALSYDDRAKRLYVGEKKDDGTGVFTIFNLAKDKAKSSFDLVLPPAELAFIP